MSTRRSSPGQVVVIGVGQLRNNRVKDPAQAREPIDLIAQAAAAAAQDAGLAPAELAGVGAVGVIQVVSWRYDDLGAAVARRLGAETADAIESGPGGHQPVAVLSELAERVARGDADLALLCGGEAQSSLELLGAGKDPGAATGWSHEPGGPGRFSRSVGGTERMWDLGLVGPTRVYPLWENGLRHRLGQTFAESHAWSASMYADLSRVAEGNDAAWNPEPLTADEIAEVTDTNRMICYPYPLRMNALNRVDQAGAVLLASTEAADRLGVPPDQRIYLHASAGSEDCEDVLERPAYDRSAGLESSLDAVLKLAGTDVDTLDVLDLYSCFPVVPKLAALHLGLRKGASVSVTGGLTSFGGPHNNYSTHALVAATRRLREGSGTGLVYANGEYLTKHCAVVLGTEPARDGFVATMTSSAQNTVIVDDGLDGPLDIETFTVEFDRKGVAVRGYVIGRDPASGRRTGVRVSSTDRRTLEWLTDPDQDPVGMRGLVVVDGGRRLFTR